MPRKLPGRIRGVAVVTGRDCLSCGGGSYVSRGDGTGRDGAGRWASELMYISTNIADRPPATYHLHPACYISVFTLVRTYTYIHAYV